jgi:hypothetical protein
MATAERANVRASDTSLDPVDPMVMTMVPRDRISPC